MTLDVRRSRSAGGPGLFGSAIDLLVAYARVHRDRRNIQTHWFGVPLGVMAMTMLLRGPQPSLAAGPVTPAWAACGLACAWYLTRGQLRLGLAASAFVAALVYATHRLPVSGLAAWVTWTVGLSMLGSLLQAAGHYYEGRRPASWDSPVHLLVGPMFVAVDMLSNVGFLRSLSAEIDRRAGPVHVRDLAHPMAQR